MMGLWKPYLGGRIDPGDVFQLSMSDVLGCWMLWPHVQRTEGTFGTQWVPSVKCLSFCHLAGFRWVRGAGHCHISDSHEFGWTKSGKMFVITLGITAVVLGFHAPCEWRFLPPSLPVKWTAAASCVQRDLFMGCSSWKQSKGSASKD